MIVQVPFRVIRRVPATDVPDAFLIFADGPAPLAAACVRLGAMPKIFAVRGGFLLVPRSEDRNSIPGAIGLRRLLGDLFVPVDADLLPSLLPDEAASLTADRGLVVLPGGAVLAFDPTAPLSVKDWLAVREVRRVQWRPFPPRPHRPNALGVIERPSSPVAVVEILGAGAPDDAQPLSGPDENATGPVPDEARPAQTGSRLDRAAAAAGLAAGGLLAWLGKQLGTERLARLGGDLARRALERVPRLTEKLLGEQEAALREVLRQLQSGDVEKGLRRAPIAVSDPDQPARVGTDAQLAAREPRYSLLDLIGSGGGAATAWLGGGDVWAQLAREYRRLAAEAAARGDHRRAAYLYGVLLRDLRSAANTLLAGGLFRDAAMLLRDRLNDPRGAADAFERAGDHDEAIRLYDRLGEYERAADLLRRLGEEERAVGYYFRAADRLVAARCFVDAGDLMRVKACRREAATERYRAGWLHGGAEAVTCATRLLDEYLVSDKKPAVAALLDEVETALANRPRDAGRFFGYALRVSVDFLSVEAHADLADRVRLIFAAHLRTAAMIGEAAARGAELFPADGPWPPPVNRDATFAVRKRPWHPVQFEPPPQPLVKVTAGPVCAVAIVRGTFDLVLAGSNGIVCWRVAAERFVTVSTARSERVTALSVSEGGEVIYALTNGTDGMWRIRCFAADRAGAFRATTQYTLKTDESENPAIYLQQAAKFRDGEYRVIVTTPVGHYAFVGSHLQTEPEGEEDEPFPDVRPLVRLVVDTGHGRMWWWVGTSILLTPAVGSTIERWLAPWMPATLVDWLTPSPGVLEIALVDTGGCVHWAEFDARDPNNLCDRKAFATHVASFSVVCLVAPGLLVAATKSNEIHWLRAAGGSLTATAWVDVGIPGHVVALAARPNPNEVVVVLADGHAVQLRRP